MRGADVDPDADPPAAGVTDDPTDTVPTVADPVDAGPVAAANAPWQALPLVPYGAVLHLPAGWEMLPPVPANGPEIMRATGGPGWDLIVFKMPAKGLAVAQVADLAEQKLADRGFETFSRTEVALAGRPGVALDFVAHDSAGALVRWTREYFVVRGHAAFVLGMASRQWGDHLPLIEEIAKRFELVD